MKNIFKKIIYTITIIRKNAHGMVKYCASFLLLSELSISISCEKLNGILELPEELKIKIVHCLDDNTKTNILSTCREFREDFYNKYIEIFSQENFVLFYNNFGVSEFFFRKFNSRFFKTVFLYLNIKNDIAEPIDYNRFNSLCNIIKNNDHINNNKYIINFVELLYFDIFYKKNQNYKSNLKTVYIKEKDTYFKKMCKLNEELIFVNEKILENRDTHVPLCDHVFFNTKVICMLDLLFRNYNNYSDTLNKVQNIIGNNIKLNKFFEIYIKIKSLRESQKENNTSVFIEILKFDPGILIRDVRCAAEIYFCNSLYEKYLECYENIIHLYRNAPTLVDLRKAGASSLKLNKYEQANLYYNKIFKKYKKKININDLRMASIAAFYIGNYDLSKKYLKKAISRNHIINYNHETIEDYRKLSVIYKRNYNYKKSLYYGKKVLKIALGYETHQDYRCVSYCYEKLRNYDKSLRYYLKLFERNDYKFVLNDLINVRYLCIKNNNLIQALIYEKIIDQHDFSASVREDCNFEENDLDV